MNPQDHLAEARRISFDQTGQYLSDAEINAFKVKTTELGPNPYNTYVEDLTFGNHGTGSSIGSTNPNNGGDTDYYRIPSDATMLQDLIEFKSMSWNQANIFKAAYRLGDPQTHSSMERDLNKIIWFAQRMLNQLSKESNGHH